MPGTAWTWPRSAARFWSPESSPPSHPRMPPAPLTPLSTSQHHASPGEAPDGGRVDAPGASRRTAQALCRRDPLVSPSAAARTGPSPMFNRRAPPVPPLRQRSATVATIQARHLAAALTTATARTAYKKPPRGTAEHRTTSPTPSSTHCPSLESGGATPRRNRAHPSRTAPPSNSHTPASP